MKNSSPFFSCISDSFTLSLLLRQNLFNLFLLTQFNCFSYAINILLSTNCPHNNFFSFLILKFIILSIPPFTSNQELPIFFQCFNYCYITRFLDLLLKRFFCELGSRLCLCICSFLYFTCLTLMVSQMLSRYLSLPYTSIELYVTSP